MQSMFKIANPCYDISLGYLQFALILSMRVRVVFIISVNMVIRLVYPTGCRGCDNHVYPL
jgi:hypothetical protein